MKAEDLLAQFIQESREGLETIGQRLLQVERDPGDAALLADLFRQVHTLKGNCGLFEFKPLERVVHAGEDLLDQVRGGALPYTGAMADALLDAMDFASLLLDAIEARGALPADAEPRSVVLAAQLRAQLPAARDGTTAVPGAAAATAPSTPLQPAEPPGWLDRVPGPLRSPGRVALRYRPEPECFFKGEDPWHVARTVPQLVHLDVAAATPWPAPEVFDCYRCNLDIVLVSEASTEALDHHFRYVPEQVERWVLVAAAAAPASASGADAAAAVAAAPLRAHVTALWTVQCEVLATGEPCAGTVQAVRRVLQRLRDLWVGAGGGAAAVQAAAGEPGEPPTAPEAVPDGDAEAVRRWALAQPQAARATTLADAVPVARAPAAGAVPAATVGADPEAAVATDRPQQRVVKVSQERIDTLMDLIGEMVVAKNALPYLARRAEDVFQQRDLAREIKAQYAVINRVAEDMQRAIMQVRMLPVGTIFQRFTRLVRDLSRRLGKEVRLVIEGEDTEADKSVIESLADPLIHIVRNSLDHGLERPDVRQAAGKPPVGTIHISARQDGDRVVLVIRDDGAGVDTARVRVKAVERGLVSAERAAAMSETEAVQLVFAPGFSTADSISDLSGRGVGMDVVRSAVERIGGTVALASTRGTGTSITLTLPLSMAVSHVMMIEAAGNRFGVPMDAIVETVRVHRDDVHRFKQASTTVLRGRVVALRALHDLLALGAQPRTNDEGELAVAVLRGNGEPVGVLVDDFHGTADIILKPLDGVLAGITAFAGSALMGDGSVLMVLDPREIV
jgi:two-component system chemotaxis sensor kinase CheA